MEEIFGPQGLIAKYHPKYEYRSGQVTMAKAVFSAMREGKCLLSEAGTGTGKTLAYLVPALALNKKVIVSTATKNLQEQLYNKDIPFLEKMLGRKLRVAYLKGRSNYLCLYRLKRAEQTPILQGLDELDLFDEIRKWSVETETGDRAELVTLPEDINFWYHIDARSDICIGQKCPEFDSCFITKARQRAQEADIIIVNHHLFFADLSLRNRDYGHILPDYSIVIFDEAHEIEEIAAEYFGTQVSNYTINDLIQDLQKLPISDHDGATNLLKVMARLSERAENFWAAFYRRAPEEGRHAFDLSFFVKETENVKRPTEVGESYIALDTILERLIATLLNLKDAPAERDVLVRRTEELRYNLEYIVNKNNPTYVYWYERRGRGIFLQATPIDVSAILSERLFSEVDSVVLTSATLTSSESFDFIRNRLGTGPAQELKIDSHFDYASQALLYLPPRMPDPRNPNFTGASVDEIVKILTLTKGRAFVLFTSSNQMREVYQRVQPQIPFPTLIQGQSSKAALLERFCKTPNSVLFAVSSFWQGVDVQGEALSCVIIDKLPFAVPSDPVVAARQSYIDEQGGNSFFDYSVPQAIITLKQGLGRLIRSKEDIGILSILDPRLRTKSYGRMFLESLPPCPVTTRRDDIALMFSK
ncbi:MAG: ATP-dependent DNA helicase [Acidobacteria bacterium]|nr:ATP-dependent DNA helicase [Acidobacteriota bacterium]